jgi:ABC-type antimicrobial peptide transport system permease subunit
MMMLGAFAAIALTLAAVGLYGVLDYLVSQRTREIGMRIAMGAGKEEIVLMVMSEGLWPVLAGIAAGLVITLSAGRILEAILYGVTVHDPWILASVPILILLTALLSMLTSARRARQIDPIIALRTE